MGHDLLVLEPRPSRKCEGCLGRRRLHEVLGRAKRERHAECLHLLVVCGERAENSCQDLGLLLGEGQHLLGLYLCFFGQGLMIPRSQKDA